MHNTLKPSPVTGIKSQYEIEEAHANEKLDFLAVCE